MKLPQPKAAGMSARPESPVSGRRLAAPPPGSGAAAPPSSGGAPPASPGAPSHNGISHGRSPLALLLEAEKDFEAASGIEEVLRQVVQGATLVSGSERAFTCLFDPSRRTILRGVARGVDKPSIRAIAEHADVRRALETHGVTRINQSGTGWTVAGFETSAGTSGLLAVGSGDPRRVDGGVDERQDLLRLFAARCGAMIGSAELQDELARRHSEIESVIQGVPGPMLVADSSGNLVAVNPAAEALFGVSSVFSKGVPVTGALGNPEIERLLSQSRGGSAEVVAGNPPRIYQVRASELAGPAGTSNRMVVMEDLTSRRNVVQQQRDFASMIGHELRTPLTIIKGFARTLLKRLDTAQPEDLKTSLKTIDQRASQLERLIEDLLYVSRIETRGVPLRIEEVDVAGLLRIICADAASEWPGREITVSVPPSLKWPCDETKIGLVLRHLVQNALKYSEAPEPVSIRAWAEDGSLRVTVTDRGIGIVSSDLPHIFDRFRQVDSSSTRQQGGTGVGLYLCDQLVRLLGAKLSVDSTWGKGSTFTLSLGRDVAPGTASFSVTGGRSAPG